MLSAEITRKIKSEDTYGSDLFAAAVALGMGYRNLKMVGKVEIVWVSQLIKELFCEELLVLGTRQMGSNPRGSTYE